MSNSNENIFDELKNKVTGDIYTDKIRRYMHSTDGSIFRVEPACIVYPKSTDDVVEIVKFANKYQISIHSRGTEERKEQERAKMELVKASVKSYENISCYSVQGPGEDSYVIFPYYEIR